MARASELQRLVDQVARDYGLDIAVIDEEEGVVSDEQATAVQDDFTEPLPGDQIATETSDDMTEPLPEEGLWFEVIGADGDDGEAVHRMTLGALVELVHANFVGGFLWVRPLDDDRQQQAFSEERCRSEKALPRHLRPLTEAARRELEVMSC